MGRVGYVGDAQLITTENEIVVVKWLDSYGMTGEWERRDELETLLPAVCVSAGHVLEQTDSYITLAMTVSDRQVLGRLTIPRAAIIQMESYGEGES